MATYPLTSRLLPPFQKKLTVSFFAFICASFAGGVQAQSLQVLLSAPGVQNTELASALVEDFGSGPAAPIAGGSGTWAVGGFSATTGTQALANQYGGAGGADRYLQVQGGPIDVNLTPGYEYVGFWWSAGDATNAITFYDNAGNQLIQFTTADINALLSGGGNITAINGSSYPKSAYFGNPNAAFAGQNGGEPYAYVNLILNNSSVKFGSVKITGSNFELDNLALAHPLPAPPGTWVPVSDYPVKLKANDDAYATVAAQSVAGNVATNDPAATGTSAVYAVDTGPAHGTLSAGVDPVTGAFVYTPSAGFTGTDTFTYTRCRADQPTLCDTATVTIVVIDAVNDNNATQANQSVSGGVTANDAVPGGSYSTPGGSGQGGTATMAPDGSYTYTPPAGFAGVDSFSYTACLPSPNQAVCDTAQVVVTVRPDAINDSAATPVNTPVNGSVAGNDVGGAVSTFTKLTDPTHGAVTVNADGTYIYTPAAGYTGPDSFTYRACLPSPNQTLCDDATVNLTVLGATADSGVTKVNTPVSGNVAGNDGTVPVGATFTKISDPAHGTVVLSPDGSYTYTPAVGYAGPDSFTYDLCTAGATPVCSRTTVSLFVIAAVNDSASTLMGTPVNGTVAGNDTVPPGAVFSGPTSGPAHGTATVNPDGTYTYTPAPGYAGPDSFDYQTCVGEVCSTAKVTIQVASLQPVPTLSQWALVLLSGLMGLVVWVRRRAH